MIPHTMTALDSKEGTLPEKWEDCDTSTIILPDSSSNKELVTMKDLNPSQDTTQQSPDYLMDEGCPPETNDRVTFASHLAAKAMAISDNLFDDF